MLNLGTGELLVIFLVALIVLGPNKLPEAARQVGRMVTELRKLSTGFQDEMRAAMQEPPPSYESIVESQTDDPAPEDVTPPATPRPRRRAPLRADGASSPGPQPRE